MFEPDELEALRARASAALKALAATTDLHANQRAELKAAGVSDSRIEALYPYVSENIERVRSLVSNPALVRALTLLLVGRQFVTALSTLPSWKLRDKASSQLAAAGIDEGLRWGWSFESSAGIDSAPWILYQWSELLVFLRAVAMEDLAAESDPLHGQQSVKAVEESWHHLTTWVGRAEKLAGTMALILWAYVEKPSLFPWQASGQHPLRSITVNPCTASSFHRVTS